MLSLVWCTTYIILLDQCYTRSEKSITSPAMFRKHLHHMDHPLDLRCHLLQYVCSPFEVEGKGELIGEVVVEMVGEVKVEMVRAVVVHLRRHCLLQYPPYLPITRDFIPPQTYTSPSIPLDTYTSLPYPVSPEPTSIAVVITLSSHPLSSPTLPPIGDTIVDFVSELGALLARRPCAPRIR